MRVYIKIFALVACLSLCFGSPAMANNIQITSKPILKDVSGQGEISFNMSWNNSWRLASFKNWDAAWVFVKYRETGGVWKAAYLNNSGHKVNKNNGVAPFFEPAYSSVNGKDVCVGLFIYRDKSGKGNINWQETTLKWNYKTQSTNNISQIEIDVFALEMVYIPEGSFYLGSGSTTETAAFKSADSEKAFLLSSENELLLTNTTTSIQGLASNGNIWPSTGAEAVAEKLLPASFPKGHCAFYAMKYELSQEAYKDFLNSLTPIQQSARSGKTINDASAWSYLYDRNTYRNGLMLIKKADNSLAFACNYYNEDKTEAMVNRPTDGQNLPMNYLSLDDHLSYLDWAGLRPLSELEYEKMCRGNLKPLKNEYAWGSLSILSCGDPRSTASDIGGGIEKPDKGNYNGSTVPLRVGAFAGEKTHRAQAGAGYYGCMDLTSNLGERYVNITYLSSHSFNADAGDGELEADGSFSKNLSWPLKAENYIWRGGLNSSYLTVSDRYYYSSGRTSASREYYSGARGGRSIN